MNIKKIFKNVCNPQPVKLKVTDSGEVYTASGRYKGVLK